VRFGSVSINPVTIFFLTNDVCTQLLKQCLAFVKHTFNQKLMSGIVFCISLQVEKVKKISGEYVYFVPYEMHGNQCWKAFRY